MSEPSFLPFPTDLVPAEELSGNLDPLGTLTHAERLAEALLSGFTVWMWRGEAVSELLPWLSANAGKSKQMVAVPILQKRPYKTTGLHLPADQWELLNRVAFERARTRGGRASVSALLVDMIEKNRKALELEKTVR